MHGIGEEAVDMGLGCLGNRGGRQTKIPLTDGETWAIISS
jgi:hypothetical protein